MTVLPSTDSAALLATAKVWRLASRTFAVEVDRPFYRALRGLGAAARLQTIGFVPLDDSDTRDEDQALTDLAVEYARLFIGPGPVCPPYASLQRGSAHHGGHALRRIEDFLHRHSLAVELPDGAPILALDHAAVAFALLDQLCTAAAGQPTPHISPDQARNAMQELLTTCLQDWLPQFLHTVEDASRETLYRAIARLATLLLTDSPPPSEGDAPRC